VDHSQDETKHKIYAYQSHTHADISAVELSLDNPENTEREEVKRTEEETKVNSPRLGTPAGDSFKYTEVQVLKQDSVSEIEPFR
jgi:hypothetical protein